MYPSYLEAYTNASLNKIIDEAFVALGNCGLCPRKCKVNRLKDEKGFCKTGLKARIYSFMAHHGEEPPISGTHGSGTIFFSNCNMGCVYCQNHEFSQGGQGREVDFEELGGIMLELQGMGCHNINLVTPTHVMPQILRSLAIAVPKGLKLPIVYNTSGYESAKELKSLQGIVDIYLADMRYADPSAAKKYSGAADYPGCNRAALIEMHRQVGVAEMDVRGILKKGLIIRHLVLPGNVSGTEEIMKFIAENLSKDTYISLMSQYMPCYKANRFAEINRRITYREYEAARETMDKYGLSNGWLQEAHGLERFAGHNIKPA